MRLDRLLVELVHTIAAFNGTVTKCLCKKSGTTQQKHHLSSPKSKDTLLWADSYAFQHTASTGFSQGSGMKMSSKLPIQSLTQSRWGRACKLRKLCQLLKDPGLYISQRSSMKLVLFAQTAKCHVVDWRTSVRTFTVVSSCVFLLQRSPGPHLQVLGDRHPFWCVMCGTDPGAEWPGRNESSWLWEGSGDSTQETLDDSLLWWGCLEFVMAFSWPF